MSAPLSPTLTIPQLQALPVGSQISVRGAGRRVILTRTADGFLDGEPAAGTIDALVTDLYALTAWDARPA